jgi:hypothetical protein
MENGVIETMLTTITIGTEGDMSNINGNHMEGDKTLWSMWSEMPWYRVVVV